MAIGDAEESVARQTAALICEVCGNEDEDAFALSTAPTQVTEPGADLHLFDTFECAMQALAHLCERCGVRIVGHVVRADGIRYCSEHCAREATRDAGAA